MSSETSLTPECVTGQSWADHLLFVRPCCIINRVLDLWTNSILINANTVISYPWIREFMFWKGLLNAYYETSRLWSVLRCHILKPTWFKGMLFELVLRNVYDEVWNTICTFNVQSGTLNCQVLLCLDYHDYKFLVNLQIISLSLSLIVLKMFHFHPKCFLLWCPVFSLCAVVSDAVSLSFLEVLHVDSGGLGLRNRRWVSTHCCYSPLSPSCVHNHNAEAHDRHPRTLLLSGR